MRSCGTATCIILLAALVAAADQGRTEIGPTTAFPVVIDAPGSYVLTADLHVTAESVRALEITTDHVDLDLGGHVIRGPGADAEGGEGIYGSGVSGVTISNGSVTGFATGVSFTFPSGSSGANRLHDLTITRCAYRGVDLQGGTARDITVQDVGFGETSGDGFVCTDCSVSNVTVRSSFSGFLILRGTAEGCVADGNFLTGFTLRGAALLGGSATNNGSDGIYANFGSVITSSVSKDNAGWGFSLAKDGGSNVVNSSAYNNSSGSITGCSDGNGCHQNYPP